MTVSRLIAILAIFCCSTVAWFALGVSVVQRTGTYDHRLEQEVAMLWGGRHEQLAPQVWVAEVGEQTETVEETGPDGQPLLKRVTRSFVKQHPLPLASSRVDVALELEHRRKGLLWYDLYAVEFSGRYRVVAPEVVGGPLRVSFRFPAADSIYDGFSFNVAGREGAAGDLRGAVMVTVDDVEAGQEIPIEIDYRSRGLDTWTYALLEQGVGQVRDFELTLTVDSSGIDFPPGTLSPTASSDAGNGVELAWRFDNLVTGKRIGVDLPNRLNPGPLTSRVTFFAPVSLLFFMTVMLIVGIVQRRNLHPMHYFFLSAAFFSFHLLLAYLVDHISIHLAFVTSAAVSVSLVVSYLRVVGGTRFAVAQAGVAQLIYLVFFNYAFFFKGFTGLTITVGAVLTLFALMQLTAKVDWDRAFGARDEDALPSAGTLTT